MPIPLIAEIVPKNNGAFALIDDTNIRGGFRIVSNLTERNAIPVDRRKEGMRVFCISTDTVYVLQPDLIAWGVDAITSANLQAAYNAGAQINTTSGNPVTIRGIDPTAIFVIQDALNNPLFQVDGDGLVESMKTFKGDTFTTSITCVAQTNNPNIVIDTVDIRVYRAVQYFYTCANSDNTGFETGQIFLVHDGFQVSVCAMMNSCIGVPCGITFSGTVLSNDMRLLATTDNSGSFSRVLRLFKVALP
jgi:hypothetical protein